MYTMEEKNANDHVVLFMDTFKFTVHTVVNVRSKVRYPVHDPIVIYL